jgi:pimeloyl-ACP methyl ester carboxylesterase
MKLKRSGTELTYDVHGEGPTVVLLHAFPFDRRMWMHTQAALATGRRVVTLDLRGFGESPLGPPSPSPSIEDFADDVSALLDALGAPMAALVGLSMGGYVALAFAHRHPARLAALVLADTRAGADAEAARQAREDGIAKVRADGTAEFLDGIPFRLLSAHAEEGLRRRVRGLAEQRAEGIVAALAAMRDRPDRSGELAALRCPTLVVVGADDTVTPPSDAQAMARAIAGARLVEIPRAGHLSNLEAPAAFERAVADFLDDVL